MLRLWTLFSDHRGSVVVLVARHRGNIAEGSDKHVRAAPSEDECVQEVSRHCFLSSISKNRALFVTARLPKLRH